MSDISNGGVGSRREQLLGHEALLTYTASSCYWLDLEATRRLWSARRVVGLAGCVVFLAYYSAPALLAIGSNTRRLGEQGIMSFEGVAERLFISRAVGIETDPSWQGGLRNTLVARSIGCLGDRHRRLDRMDQNYMVYIASVLMVSPLRALASEGTDVHSDLRSRWWRYGQHLFLLMGIAIASEPDTIDLIRWFDISLSCESELGAGAITSLCARFPNYVRDAARLLDERSRSVVSNAISGAP